VADHVQPQIARQPGVIKFQAKPRRPCPRPGRIPSEPAAFHPNVAGFVPRFEVTV
jgi:hypothetical protein